MNYLTLPNIIFGGFTDKGIREENQDAFSIEVNENIATFIVADGVGGHAFGGECSKVTVNAMTKELSLLKGKNLDYVQRLVEKKYSQINDYIYKQGKSIDAVMATTVSMINFVDDELLASNIGDTRIYLIREGRVSVISQTHTVAYEEYENKQITYEQYLSHKKKHVLSRAIGAKAQVKPYFYREQVKDEDLYIICSDGVYNFIKEEKLLEIVKKYNIKDSENLNEFCQSIVNTALGNKSNDNTTVVAIYVINR
jgi:serine/threonine protein phosphatase PrpC